MTWGSELCESLTVPEWYRMNGLVGGKEEGEKHVCKRVGLGKKTQYDGEGKALSFVLPS